MIVGVCNGNGFKESSGETHLNFHRSFLQRARRKHRNPVSFDGILSEIWNCYPTNQPTNQPTNKLNNQLIKKLTHYSEQIFSCVANSFSAN